MSFKNFDVNYSLEFLDLYLIEKVYLNLDKFLLNQLLKITLQENHEIESNI